VDFCLKATREGRKHDFEYRVIAADGRTVWLRDMVSVTAEGGEPTRRQGIMIDVTGRKHTEEALRESEELYRLLTENSNDLIYLLDLEGRVVYTSPSVSRLLGRVPRTKFEVVHPDDLEAARGCWERVLAGEKELLTVRVFDARGEWQWLEALSALVHYHGRPHVLSVCRDVSARKRAEDALKGTERQLRTLVENYPDFIARFDRECRHRYVSPAVARAFGVPADRFVGRTLHELAVNGPPGQNEALEAGIRRAFEEGAPNTLEALWSTQNGERLFEVRHIPEPDEHGHVVSVLGVTRDVTERRRAEDALRANHNLLSAVFEATPDIVFVKDLRCRFLMINSAGSRLLGMSADEILGKDNDALLSPEAAREVGACDRRVMTSGISETFEETVPIGGAPHTYLTTKDVYRDARGEIVGLLGIARDITERKRSEEALRESAERLRLAARASNVGLWDWNLRTNAVVFSREWKSQLGYEEHEIGADYREWESRLHPDDRAPTLTAIREYLDGRRPEHAVEFRLRHKDGSYRWIYARGEVFNDASGAPVRMMGCHVDVTERKLAEAERQAYLWFLESMDRVNRAIQGTDDPEQMMGAVLDVVLSIFACDRAWLVYPCDPEAPTWTAPMERTRPEYPGALALGVELPIDPEIARVFQTMRAATGSVRFGPGADHPLPAEPARQFNIRSMIATTVYPKVGQPYMFGLHQCSYAREWAPQEERLFQEVGRRLADALSNLLLVRNLRESERKLAEAQRIAHVGYWDFDLDADRITWSDETYRIFGLPPHGGARSLAQVRERLHPDDGTVLAEGVAAALRGGPRYSVEYRLVRPDGEVRTVHSQGDVVRDESGRPRRMFGTVQDVTERRQMEDRLRASEARFRTLVDHATDAFFLHDDRGVVLDANNQACESLGYSRDELIGMNPRDFNPNVDGARLAEVQRRLDAGEVLTVDTQHRRKDGAVFPVEVRIRPFWQGGRRYGVALVRDVTERKRTEEALRRSEAYLTEAQRLSRTGSWAWSVATRNFVYWSQGHYRLHGLDPERGVPSWDAVSQLIHPEDRPRCLAQIERAIRDGTTCELEYRAVLPDGTVKYIRSTAHPVFDAAGALVEFVGTEMDVTERKRAEEALTLFRSLIDRTNDSIEVVDSDTGRFLDVNERACLAHGYTREEYLSRTVVEIAPPDAAPVVEAALVQLRHTGSVFVETVHQRKDGSTFPVEVNAARIRLDRDYVVAVVRDVSERKRAEEQLRQREVDLKLALDAGRLGDWKWNVVTGEVTWSPLCKALYGLPPDAEVSYDRFLAAIHPDDRARVAASLGRVLETGADYEEEKRTVWPDGSVHWTAARGRVYRDATGRPLHVSGVTMDVTGRRRAEEELRASLQEKVVLLKEVHHRVKNNLQLVSSLLSLQAGAMKDRAVKEALTESQNRVRAMAMVHENLYRTSDLTSVRVGPHIESLCAHLWRSFGADPGRIAPDLRVADLTLDLDRALRCGLIVNELVSNAIKHAFPTGRTGRVTVKLDHLPDGWYALVVSDNGAGFPAGFDPKGSDTLGLQLVADLTEQLNGTLALNRDGGAAFTVRFPDVAP
jgi:PAS domain S-box-containing protein